MALNSVTTDYSRMVFRVLSGGRMPHAQIIYAANLSAKLDDIVCFTEED